MLMLMVMAGLLRASYELSNSKPKPPNPVSFLAKTRPVSGTTRPTGLTLQQKEWADKAVKRYAEVQEKKWRNWTDSMFEPSKQHSAPQGILPCGKDRRELLSLNNLLRMKSNTYRKSMHILNR